MGIGAIDYAALTAGSAGAVVVVDIDEARTAQAKNCCRSCAEGVSLSCEYREAWLILLRNFGH